MNRLIKFRAWDGEKMLAHVPIEAVSMRQHLEMQGTTLTLMQFTGLTDKNGKEIYEGDIIRYLNGSATGPRMRTAPRVVRWTTLSSGTGFNITEQGRKQGSIKTGQYEVIGNIYENPELIEKSV